MLKEKKTILLVEDEIIIALSESEIISGFGYHVIIAHSGEEAVEVAGTNHIDLILMDIDLGKGIDGPAAASRILEIKILPIVFLTSHCEKEFVQKVQKITRYGYVIKNSGSFILQSSIEMALKLYESNQILLQKEIELKQKEFFLYKAQEIGNIGHFSFDRNSNIIDGSPEFYKILDVNTDSGSVLDIFKKIVHPDDRDFVLKEINNVLTHGKSYDLIHRCMNNTGKITYIHSKGEIIASSTGNKVIGIIQDITEQKSVERALQDSEERFQNLFEQAPLGYQSLDENGCFIEVNQVFEQMLGYPKSEILGKWFGNFLAPEFVEHFKKRFPVFKELGQIHSEFQMVHKNGSIRDISFDGKIGYNADGTFKQTHCILADETEKHKADQILKNQELRYHEIFNNIHSGIAVYKYVESDKDFIFTDFNPAAEKVENEIKEILIGKSIYKVWPGIEKYALMETFERVNRTGIPEHCPLEIINDGKLLQYYDNYIFRISNGEIVAVFEDVTDKKHSDKNLLESRQLFSLFLKYSPIYTFIKEVTDDYSLVLEASDNFNEMIGISAEKMIGKKMEDLFPPDFAAKITADDQTVVAKGEVLKLEEELNGRSYNTIKFPIKHGDKILLAGFTIDITPQKEAEKKIIDLLAEKELILKEVHHRIKNNMTTIKSLLNLQAKTLKDSQAETALMDAASRVQSMLILYDKLYQSDSYQQIPIDSYFSVLLDQITGNFPHAKKVKIVKNIDNITLDSKRLSTLSIIINELITNIMKYAFIGRSDGIITVTVRMDNDFMVFEIHDNGVGIPESIDFKNSNGFGLMLVEMLNDQIKGSIKIHRENGTRIILKFKK